MRRGLLILLWVFVAILAGWPLFWANAHALAALTPTPAGEPGKVVVRFYLFYSDTCPHCHEIMTNYLPKVYEKYGDRVESQYLNINGDTETYITMLGLEAKLGVPEAERGYVPALVIGEKVLIGGQDIPNNLEKVIDDYLSRGGVDFPSLENLPQPEPTAQILIFFDTSHADFSQLNTLMQSLIQKYGNKLLPLAADVTQADNAAKLAQLHQAFGVKAPPLGTPEILIGRQLLVGISQIEDRLPALIEEYLSQGGVTIPPWEELVEGGLTGTATVQKPIYLAYFEKAGCQECARTTYDLGVVQERYPQVVVESFAMEDRESKALNEWLSAKSGVPEEQRLSTPMIFVGQDVLIGSAANLDNLLAIMSRYAQTGAERTWNDFDPAQAEQSLVERFRSFGVLTVLGAGLIDGLNPCAFATLVFFVSYMAFTGRRGRDILLVGIAFALGVFLTYLLVGVGLLKVVQSLSFFTALGRWVYLLTGLLCVVLAAFTFRDSLRARKGRVSEMTLKLPKALRQRIHKVIRENAQVRAFVAMAFVTGFLVSLIELACTGQVYLPTIMFVLSVPKLATQAFLYLLLYCLMFIVPLIVVFVLSYLGTSSEQLGRLVNRHTAAIKFATGLVFTGLALWMAWTLAPLFGIYDPWDWVLMGAVTAVIALGAVLLQLVKQQASSRAGRRRRSSRA